MIALEEVRVETARQAMQQHVHDAAAVRPAIDIVAEKDQRSTLGGLVSPSVRLDIFEQLGEEVRPAVNIADGVEKLSLRQRGMVQGAQVRGEHHKTSDLSQTKREAQSASFRHQALPLALRISR